MKVAVVDRLRWSPAPRTVLVGIIRDIFRGESNALIDAAASGPSFAVDAGSIPPEVYGLASYINVTAPAARVDRRTAIQVPSVKRARDLIPGVLGTLPLDLVGPDVRANYSELLDQPERNRPRSVTLTDTFEDMFFEKRAIWRVTDVGWHGYPTKVEHIKNQRVTIDDDQHKIYIDGINQPHADIIRFDSPADALLVAGARAIRTCLALDAAASRMSDGTPPVDYFTPADNIDALEKEEITTLLDSWLTARRERSTAYVPAALKYEIAGWNPEQLQMADARQHAVLQIANVAGIDPEDVGVSTTSRTYANAFDKRKDRIDFTLGMYRTAFEDRLRMGDVTPRGYVVRQNLDEFLRSDPKTRMETYEIGLRVGAYDGRDEVRALEHGAPLTTEPEAPKELPAVSADQDPTETFDSGDPVIRLDSPQDAASFEVDYERRIIRGLIVPYGVEGVANGQRWVFSQGTLTFTDPSRVKLWIQHDKNRVVGFAIELDDRPYGMYGEFSVEDGPAGDEALRKADPNGSKTWDAFSIGLRPGGKFRIRNGVNYAVEAPLMETSLTPAPSFDDARVHQVAASATTSGDSMTPEQRARLAALRAKTDLTPDEEAEKTRLAALEGTPASFGATGGQSPTFDAAPVIEAIRAGFEGLAAPGGREVVDPTGGRFDVNEEPVYRFDGHAGQFSLIDDMAAGTRGDTEARQRVDEFMNEAFAVTAANVNTLNPVQNRPELYVPNLQFSRPLWEMVSNGNIDDKTPFTVPKFASAAGLVGNHVEGVEPTPGSFSATNQTVTPTAISGKIEIDREVLDQGGSPQADQIIWGEMLNAWFEAIEARIATTLNAVPTVETNFASAVDVALVKALQSKLVGLQFMRGGNRFTGLALDGMLFPALVGAVDTTGRNLLPVIGATNAQGETSGSFDRVSVGGLTGRAAWALGATNASKSHLFVPSSVYAWASAPKRFTFEYQLKSVDMGIWGYGASAVTRDSDVQPLDYTTADV